MHFAINVNKDCPQVWLHHVSTIKDQLNLKDALKLEF